MAVEYTPLTDDAWTQIGSAISTCVLQPFGTVLVVVAEVAPAQIKVPAFSLESGIPVEIPEVALLGGNVWVRAARGTAGAAYAVA